MSRPKRRANWRPIGSWNEPKSIAKRLRVGSVASVPAKASMEKPCNPPKAESSPEVLTIGHSTRTLTEFIHLLKVHEASRVVDVRTVPRSRHNPQFNQASLSRSLKKAGLGYVHMPGLGGLRHAKGDSINVGWRNASFEGYADYMQTAEFEGSLAELIALADKDRLALMCAEAVPWRCHRSLIADALLVQWNPNPEDIMSPTVCGFISSRLLRKSAVERSRILPRSRAPPSRSQRSNVPDLTNQETYQALTLSFGRYRLAAKWRSLRMSPRSFKKSGGCAGAGVQSNRNCALYPVG